MAPHNHLKDKFYACRIRIHKDHRPVLQLQPALNSRTNTSLTIPSRSNQNTKAPIARLPIETISEIFLLLQKSQDSRSHREHPWSWMTISHICSHWRAIALSTQELWTVIETAKHATIEQTKAFLARSGTSQLVVHHRDNWGLNDKALQRFMLTLTHLHRVREMRIFTLDNFPVELREVLLANPAPLLQTFHLFTQSDRLFDVRELFQEQAPKLKTLALQVNAPSWSSVPIMRDLTELRFGSSMSPPTLQGIFSILALNPNLENLVIYWQPDEALTSDLRALREPIQLQSMKDLTISGGNHKMLCQLLKNVVFTPSMAWNIYCRDFPLNDAHADPNSIIPPYYTSTVTSTSPKAKDNQSCTYLLLAVNPHYVQLDADPPYRNGVRNSNADDPHRMVNYMWRNPLRPRETISATKGFQLLSSVVQGSPSFWGSATSICMEIEEDNYLARDLFDTLGPRPWILLLHHLPNLGRITVRHIAELEGSDTTFFKESHFGLLRALASSRKDTDGNTHFICPKLEELHLCGFNSKIGNEIGIENLIQTLEIRATHGLKLRKLEFCRAPALTERVLRTLERRGIANEIKVFQV